MSKTRVLNLLLLIGSTASAVLIVELCLQIIGRPSPVVSGWLNDKGSKLETNELGFRGQKISYSDTDYVIVLLGDSQVAARACSFDWMPESRLEHHLNQGLQQDKNVKVFSIGAGGYGQDQQLLMLEKYFTGYRADLVILWQTPDNDVWNNIFPTHWPENGGPKPTFRLISGELVGPSEDISEELAWSKVKLLALANRLLGGIDDRDGRWETHLPRPYEPMSHYNGRACGAWQRRWDNNIGLMRSENLSTEKTHFSIHLSPASARMRHGLELTKVLLNQINNVVNSNGGAFAIFRTPTSPHWEEEGCSEDEVVHSLNGKYYKTSRAQFRKNLDYINVGLTSYAVPVAISKWRVGPEDGHLNEHATDQVMQDLAGELMPLM